MLEPPGTLGAGQMSCLAVLHVCLVRLVLPGGGGPGEDRGAVGTAGSAVCGAGVHEGSTEKPHISWEELSVPWWVLPARRHLAPSRPASFKQRFAASSEAKFKRLFAKSCPYF